MTEQATSSHVQALALGLKNWLIALPAADRLLLTRTHGIHIRINRRDRAVVEKLTRTLRDRPRNGSIRCGRLMSDNRILARGLPPMRVVPGRTVPRRSLQFKLVKLKAL